MKRLYLASSIDITAENITRDIGRDPKSLKLVFITTAAEPEEGDKKWLENDENGYIKSGFDVTYYTITGKSAGEIEKDLGGFDIVHVNGGNTFYLLLQAQKSGFDKWIKRVVAAGDKIYTGSSAGSMAASPNIEVVKNIEEKYSNKLKSFDSFGLVDFIVFPHWGSEFFKSSYLNKRLNGAYKPENKIILLNDWQYIKVVGDTYKIIDIRDKA